MLLLFHCCRNTSNPEEGISQNKSFLFFFCSLLSNQWQKLQKQVSNAPGEPIHPRHINLKTLLKQILQYDHLGAKVKKISSSNNGCREGKAKSSPPLSNGANSLSQWLLSHYLLLHLPCFSSSMNSIAEHCKSTTFTRGLSV